LSEPGIPLNPFEGLRHLKDEGSNDLLRRQDMFKINVGTWDRLARVVIGLAALSLVFWGPKTAWGWLGLIPLATGLASRCPAYGVCGISTKKD
jgi:hypothetical protein